MGMRDVPRFAHSLMNEFWPGPMTLVFSRSSRAADFITGSQDSVALRVPSSPIIRDVLQELCSLRVTFLCHCRPECQPIRRSQPDNCATRDERNR